MTTMSGKQVRRRRRRRPRQQLGGALFLGVPFMVAMLFPSVASAFLPRHVVKRKSRGTGRIGGGVGGGGSFPQSVRVSVNVDDASSETTSSSSPSVDFPHGDVAEECRGDFAILSRTVTDRDVPLVYLDSAASSQKPDRVIAELDSYYREINSNVHRGAHALSRDATAKYEAARDKVMRFVRATRREEIVFTSGATESINLVAQTYGRANLRPGDEIVLTVTEHHSNLVPWQMLAEERGLALRYVRMDRETGGLDLDHFESLLDGEKTKLVAFQHVSNVLGCINPVREMVDAVRSKCPPDAAIVLDACQSVPHMPVDVTELGVDFLVASGHKMCAPTGIGFLWGRLDLLNGMPPWKGGGEMIDRVTLDGSTWQPSPARFEAGTPPIAQAIGLGAAIDYLNRFGMDRIEAYEHEIGDYLHRRLSSVPGITVLGPKPDDSSGYRHNRAALASFVHESVHPSDLSALLDMEGIAVRAGHHCCQPLHDELGYSHSARASLYMYNTKEDVDYFIEKLKDTIQFFTDMETSSSSSKASKTAAAGGDGDDDDFVPFI